ncbi:hypothetical protein HZA98_00515 [Candidatus Woesearchaeota archaeon]|nr:hypothetical protein [Candidatus Woesearchaeota archaeon]
MLAEQVSNTGCDFISYSFIFIADTHGFLNDFEKQKEIIKRISPEYVLAEQLQAIVLDTPRKYTEIEQRKDISEMVSWEEVKELIRTCKEREIKLIGMDLTNFGFNTHLQQVVKGKKELTENDEKEVESILEKRQKKHVEMCKKYKAKTNRPIIVIVGAWHLQDSSPLMQELSNYLVIFPVNKEGMMLLGPEGNKEGIRYEQKTKK